MNIHHAEYKPSKGLSDYVESYWHATCEGPANSWSAPNYGIPKGTVELIITLKGAKTEMYINEQWHQVHDVLVVGIQTTANVWRMQAGSAKFGIRLKPETFIRLFGQPVAELYQKCTDLHSLVGNRYSWLIDMIRNASTNENRIAVIESFLYKKLAIAKTGYSLLAEAIRKIWIEDGNISTACLSKSVFIGERQLQRLFKSAVGVSPKLYSRIIRFRSAYEQAQSGKSQGWTDVAYSLGYVDQAHFVKDFKSFAGVTPTVLFN
jgi:AraC-like DNA-binding protein